MSTGSLERSISPANLNPGASEVQPAAHPELVKMVDFTGSPADLTCEMASMKTTQVSEDARTIPSVFVVPTSSSSAEAPGSGEIQVERSDTEAK